MQNSQARQGRGDISLDQAGVGLKPCKLHPCYPHSEHASTQLTVGVGTDRSRLFTSFLVASARVELGTSWFTAKPAYNLAICVGFNEPYVIACIAYLYVSSVPELAISCVYILWLCKVSVGCLMVAQSLAVESFVTHMCSCVFYMSSYVLFLDHGCVLCTSQSYWVLCFLHHNHTEYCDCINQGSILVFCGIPVLL